MISNTLGFICELLQCGKTLRLVKELRPEQWPLLISFPVRCVLGGHSTAGNPGQCCLISEHLLLNYYKLYLTKLSSILQEWTLTGRRPLQVSWILGKIHILGTSCLSIMTAWNWKVKCITWPSKLFFGIYSSEVRNIHLHKNPTMDIYSTCVHNFQTKKEIKCTVTECMNYSFLHNRILFSAKKQRSHQTIEKAGRLCKCTSICKIC